MKIKKILIVLALIVSFTLFFSCYKEKTSEYENIFENLNSQKLLPQKYAYVGEKVGQLIFLDTINGKLIYVNNKNKVSNYVDLDVNAIEIDEIRNEKENNKNLHQAFDWGSRKINNTKYTISLNARYYNDKLLYILELEPYDEYLHHLANTIKIHFADNDGFTLETVNNIYWTRILDTNGKFTHMKGSGNIPITFENFMEIESWSITWEN